MFRFTRPLYQAVKKTTGITGVKVHPDPLPELIKTYQSTLTTLSTLPPTAVYRQSTEALTHHKLNIANAANGNIAEAEKQLNEGQIEDSLEIAAGELSLASALLKWKAWEPLEEKPEPGQWEYPGKPS